jgi:hypothetical protein
MINVPRDIVSGWIEFVQHRFIHHSRVHFSNEAVETSQRIDGIDINNIRELILCGPKTSCWMKEMTRYYSIYYWKMKKFQEIICIE